MQQASRCQRHRTQVLLLEQYKLLDRAEPSDVQIQACCVLSLMYYIAILCFQLPASVHGRAVCTQVSVELRIHSCRDCKPACPEDGYFIVAIKSL